MSKPKLGLPDYLDQYRRRPNEIVNDHIVATNQIVTGELNRSISSRRPTFDSPIALQYAVDSFFADSRDLGREPTVPGLILALGFSNKHKLKAFAAKNEEFQDIIDTAITRLEERRNVDLLKGGPATQGIIMDLKNYHGWRDKVEQTIDIAPGGSLEELVQSLQGRVFRPTLPVREDEVIEDAEIIPDEGEGYRI